MTYTASIVLGSATGALSLVRHEPRRTGKARTRTHALGYQFGEEEWEDTFHVVGLERLSGGMGSMASRIDELLRPIRRQDRVAYADMSALGSELPRLFRETTVYPIPVLVSETSAMPSNEGGIETVPSRDIFAVVAVLAEQKRLAILQELRDSPMLGKALEHPDHATGPAADLARATALALWAARRRPSHGPWAASPPPEPGTDAAFEREEQRYLARLTGRVSRRARAR